MAVNFITGPAGAQTITSSSTLIVTQDGLITSATNGVTDTGYNTQVSVFGEIHAADYGVRLDNVNFNTGAHVVNIGEDGVISSAGSNAVYLGGNVNRIANNGEIIADISSGIAAVFFSGNNGDLVNTGRITGSFGISNVGTNIADVFDVVNSGTIYGTQFGVYVDTQRLDLFNSGEIQGLTSAIRVVSADTDGYIVNTGLIKTPGGIAIDLNSGADTVINTGLIVGHVLMGADNDTYDGRGGRVIGTVSGGQGNDTYYVSDTDTKLFETSGPGIDTVYASTGWTLGYSFENLTLQGNAKRGIGNGEDNVIVGNDADNRLRGKAGDDTIVGGNGDDNIKGNRGNDVLSGDDGDDIVKGNRGNDTLLGGGGDDQLKGGVGSDRYVFEFNYDGNDTIKDVGGSSDTLAVTGRVMSQLDFRRSGNDLVIESGGTVDRVVIDDFYIAGDAGRIELLETTTTTKYMQTGLIGGATADIIVGFSGTQIINGGGGDDILIGKGGKDRITGGSGADRFDYDALSDSGTTATTMDTIYDFVAGTDRIDLFDIDADSTTAGNQNFSFIGAGAYTGTAGELRYQFVGGNTRLGVDVDGDMIDDFNILLAGNIAFSAGDFVL